MRFTRNICCPTKIPNVAYIVIFVMVYILYTDQGINGAPYRDWIKQDAVMHRDISIGG